MSETQRRFMITAELLVEVTDAAILRRAALDRVAEAGFVADGDRGADQVRAAERDAVHADVAAALDWVVDADAIVEEAAGAEVVGSTVSVAEEGAAGAGADEMPDFARSTRPIPRRRCWRTSTSNRCRRSPTARRTRCGSCRPS